MRKCSDCHITKDLLEFNRSKAKLLGRKYRCRICEKLKNLLDRDKIKVWQRTSYKNNLRQRKKYLQDNKNVISKSKYEYYKQNLKQFANSAKKFYKNKPYIIHANSVLHWLKTKSKRPGCVPKWLTKEHKKEIARFYECKLACQRLIGVKLNVDHIVPIHGKNVCGLHVPWNLQIITAEENAKKSNKFE